MMEYVEDLSRQIKTAVGVPWFGTKQEVCELRLQNKIQFITSKSLQLYMPICFGNKLTWWPGFAAPAPC